MVSLVAVTSRELRYIGFRTPHSQLFSPFTPRIARCPLLNTSAILAGPSTVGIVGLLGGCSLGKVSYAVDPN
jgi:hypothetical protein